LSEKQGLTLPLVISLVGGLIVLVFSLVNFVWFGSGTPSWGSFGNTMSGMMGGYHNFMGSYGSSSSFFTAISMVRFVCGVIVLMSALVLRNHPQEQRHMGNRHRCIFSRKLRWHGRLLCRCSIWHHRRSNRLNLQTNNLAVL
jgi:uncharacterized membrane protein